jgi:NAD(P)H dehydrogenase (quinone)
MKAHIVFAHPNLHSFNGQMRNTAIQTLEALGWEVSVSDLYQLNFKAAADQADFTQIHNTAYFDIQTEQAAALQKGTFTDDIKKEHQLLSQADFIIFQFPLWWYSMPALLKGYIDRVFSMGWAYGGGQALAGKKILVSLTTGAPDFAWTPEKRGTIVEIFKHLFVGTFGLCGMVPTTPFIVYGAKRITEQTKADTFEAFKNHIQVCLQ